MSLGPTTFTFGDGFYLSMGQPNSEEEWIGKGCVALVIITRYALTKRREWLIGQESRARFTFLCLHPNLVTTRTQRRY